MSQAQFTIPLITVIPGQLITAALWNNELTNIGTNLNPSGIGGYSDTGPQSHIQTSPATGATSLAGELERIRYQLAQLLGTTFWDQAAATSVSAINNIVVPVGGIIDFPVVTPPNSNWHVCDGTALNPATYATLFSFLGTTFGGNGVTTFNLPNYTDRMSIGAGNLYAVAATGGEATHVLLSTEIPAHNHTASSVVTDPAHQHVRSMSSVISVDNTGSTRVDTYGSPATDPGSKTDLETTGVTVATTVNPNTGGGGAHNNIPPYLAMYKMIRIL
jgi:microcystin-dependent protein